MDPECKSEKGALCLSLPSFSLLPQLLQHTMKVAAEEGKGRVGWSIGSQVNDSKTCIDKRETPFLSQVDKRMKEGKKERPGVVTTLVKGEKQNMKENMREERNRI